MPPKRRKHVPLRSCIACRQRYPKRELIRVIRAADGTVEIDPTGKRPGRGAYLCRNWQCWELALEPQRLSQALKCTVSTEEATVLKALACSLVGEPAVESETTLTTGVSAEG